MRQREMYGSGEDRQTTARINHFYSAIANIVLAKEFGYKAGNSMLSHRTVQCWRRHRVKPMKVLSAPKFR